MKATKKIGRPPAPWVFEMARLDQESNIWLDITEISDIFNVHVNTAKTFLSKTSVDRKYEIVNGRTKMKLKVSDLKKAAQDYIRPWM
jgi:hypothetical protein